MLLHQNLRFLVGLLVLALVTSCHAKYPGTAVLQQLSSGSDPADPFDDQAVLAQLKAAGSDLSKQTDIVFYLYIPLHANALMCAAELGNDGFQSEVDTPLGKISDGTTENRWSVISHLTAVPTLKTIHRAAAAMTKLALRYGGEYDGWEAAIEK